MTVKHEDVTKWLAGADIGSILTLGDGRVLVKVPTGLVYEAFTRPTMDQTENVACCFIPLMS